MNIFFCSRLLFSFVICFGFFFQKNGWQKLLLGVIRVDDSFVVVEFFLLSFVLFCECVSLIDKLTKMSMCKHHFSAFSVLVYIVWTFNLVL